MRAAVVAVVAVLAARPRHAFAQPAAPDWTIAPIAGTDFPLDFYAGVQVEAPNRLRASTTIGFMPRGYVDVIDKVLVGLGAYDQDVANLIESALASSLVWRTHVGYRPWASHGFYAMAGYGLVTLGGGATASELITAATGKQLPVTDQGAPRSFDCRSTLHMADVEVGWEWHVDERWLVRAAVGGGFTFAASTSITPQYTPRDPRATEQLTDYGAGYLDGIYTSYVDTALITIAGGYTW
ncbi:MAG TPA: hypothetical protein VMJ10_10910 [Kofleriaceae bacterium]|nr:hypothetical protein [Kofleriaceae bacterium]